jgi:altronate hydrolase
MYERMEDDMDFNAAQILDGSTSVQEAGEKIFRLILATASGEPSKSERHGFGAGVRALVPGRGDVTVQ